MGAGYPKGILNLADSIIVPAGTSALILKAPIVYKRPSLVKPASKEDP
jgi:hypothetical protein